ncbi:MAG: hypothetical protein QQN46_08910 [Nitrosopumilus sp.]
MVDTEMLEKLIRDNAHRMDGMNREAEGFEKRIADLEKRLADLE